MNHDTALDITPSFVVVFVCTGNRARSPLAAALLRQRAASSVDARSVGTLRLGPVPPLDSAVRLALRYGADLSSHRATTLEPRSLREANLVIGFEPIHLSTAVVDGGAELTRTYSLIELAAILEALDADDDRPADPEAFIRKASRRPRDLLAAPSLCDPIGRPDDEVVACFDSIDRHVSTIARVLFSPAAESAQGRVSTGGDTRVGLTRPTAENDRNRAEKDL